MRFWMALAIFLIVLVMVSGCQVEELSQVKTTIEAEPNPTVTQSHDETASPSLTSVEPATSAPVIEDVQTTKVPESTLVEEMLSEGSGNADVEFVRAVHSIDGSWTFHVTVRHQDTGWEDYADGWDVVDPEGNVLKINPDDPFTRLLLHPHENEQPFTRSQSGIPIPAGVSQVSVRAHDLVDGYGGREIVVDLTAETGEGFQIER